MLPDDAELVFEASGRPRPRWARCCVPPPAAAPWSRSATCPAPPVSAVLGDLVTREITWIGSYRFVDEITDAVAALRDGLDVSPLITTPSTSRTPRTHWPSPATGPAAAARSCCGSMR